MSVNSLKDKLISAWRIIAAVCLVLGGLASLQSLGLLQVLVNSLSLLSVQIPIYAVAILGIILVVAHYILRNKRETESVLRLEDARRIVRLCATPQATDFLRSNYDGWQRASTALALITFGFNDILKDLEKGKFLEYVSGKWRTTNKAFEIVGKYHGDP